MSTQSISQINLNKIKNKLDQVLTCVSNKMILSDKLAFKNNIDNSDIFTLNYLYNVIHNQINCFLILDKECTLEKINQLLLKYK